MIVQNKKKIVISLVLVTALFLAFNVSVSTGASWKDRLLNRFKPAVPPEPLLPPKVTVKPGFAVGVGKPIGEVQKTAGTVYVVHQGQDVAYKMKKNFSVFTGDTFISSKRSRLNIIMKDKSVIALAPESKLTIDKSIYDPEKDVRSSLIRVLFGRIRFIVQKVAAKPNYVVMTKTAIIGVRGSDFAISVSAGDEQTSADQSFFKQVGLGKEAKAAAAPAVFVTTVLTGPATTVSFTGAVGTTVMVGPASAAMAVAGAAATTPVVVGAAAALAILQSIAPGLATLGMPPEYD